VRPFAEGDFENEHWGGECHVDDVDVVGWQWQPHIAEDVQQNAGEGDCEE